MTKKLTKSVLRYAGGKSRAIKIITPYVEEYGTVVSPFLGGSLGKHGQKSHSLRHIWNVD